MVVRRDMRYLGQLHVAISDWWISSRSTDNQEEMMHEQVDGSMYTNEMNHELSYNGTVADLNLLLYSL
jgi:hypothetical protein